MSLCSSQGIDPTCFGHGTFDNSTCSCVCEYFYLEHYSCEINFRQFVIGDGSFIVFLLDLPFYSAVLAFNLFLLGFIYVFLASDTSGRNRRGSWSILLFLFTCVLGQAQLFCNYNSYNDGCPYYTGQFLWVMMYVATLSCHSAVVYSFFDMMAIFDKPLATIKRKAKFRSAQTILCLTVLLLSSYFAYLLSGNSILLLVFNLSLLLYLWALKLWVSSLSQLCSLISENVTQVRMRNKSACTKTQTDIIYQVTMYIKYFKWCAVPSMLALVYLIVTKSLLSESSTIDDKRRVQIIGLTGAVIPPLISEVLSMGLILWLSFKSRRMRICFNTRNVASSKLTPTQISKASTKAVEN